jgi:hypothetical protein
MLIHLGSDARLFVFAREVCRGWWRLPLDVVSREVVTAYERWLDGEGSWDSFQSSVYAVSAACDAGERPLVGTMVRWWPSLDGVAVLVDSLAQATTYNAHRERIEELERNSPAGGHIIPEFRATIDMVYRTMPSLLREIIGNPFRRPHLPAPLPPWVTSIADAAYDARDPSSGHLDGACLGVLADALEEVGADEGLVAHLREPGPHPARCQAVDLVRAGTTI